MLINTAYTIFNVTLLLYNLTTLCLNGKLSCVDSMDVIKGDLPVVQRQCFTFTTPTPYIKGVHLKVNTEYIPYVITSGHVMVFITGTTQGYLT